MQVHLLEFGKMTIDKMELIFLMMVLVLKVLGVGMKLKMDVIFIQIMIIIPEIGKMAKDMEMVFLFLQVVQNTTEILQKI